MAMELLAARNLLQPRTVASKKSASMKPADSALPLWTVVGTTLAPTLPSLLVGGKPVRFYT
jgi:hypothetical protein